MSDVRRLLLAPLLALGLGLSSARAASPAPAPVTLRVMTFNIWYGGDQVSFPKIAEAIRAADADIVGIEEADGDLGRLADAAGYPYVDERRRILSRYPIFDPAAGMRTDTGTPPYSIIALDRTALQAWVMVRFGEIVGVAVTHLSSDPSGLERARQGSSHDAVMALERSLRLPEAVPLTALAKVAADGTPVFLLGDFNTPSHLDWTPAVARERGTIPYAMAWPVSKLLADAGLRDSYREAHPDPVAVPGLTWTAGQPNPVMPAGGTFDRIDFVYTAGRSRTLASQIVGEAGGPDVDIAVMPYPSDHRAVVSTFSVVPRAAPPLIAVEPRRVIAGSSFIVRAYDPTRPRWTAVVVHRGDGAKAALTGLYNITALFQTSVKLSTYGLAPGDYDALLLDRQGASLKRTTFTIAPADARPSLTVPVARVARGAPIPVRWGDTEGNARDWIGLYAAGDPDVSAYKGWTYTQALFSGQGAIAAPAVPGRYELRLMRDESYVVQAAAPVEVTDMGRQRR